MRQEIIDAINKTLAEYPSYDMFGFKESLYENLMILDKKSSFDMEQYAKFFMLWHVVMEDFASIGSVIKNWDSAYKKNPSLIDKHAREIDAELPKLGGGWNDWVSICMPNTPKQEEGLKLYLSVDDSSLHLFANSFLVACITNGYEDFNFKINKKEDINRRDNVVVYCTNENVSKYINIINQILSANPNIKFNAQSLLAMPCNEHISIGMDPGNGQSYSSKMCNIIIDKLERGKTPEAIADDILTSMSRYTDQLKQILESDGITR